MDLSKILSISGKPGLYKLIGEAKSNLVVESLIDGKRSPAFPHERISSLKEISIYASDEDVPLNVVFRNLHEVQEGKPVDNPKKMGSEEMKELFEKALPDYDKEAVYTSDMKKVFIWYNILLDKDLLDFSDEEEEKKEEPKEDSTEAKPAAE